MVLLGHEFAAQGIDMTQMVQRFLRRQAVQDLTGLSKTAIYVQIAAGRFPKPVPLGEGRNSPVAWPENEIAAWQAGRLAKRNSQDRS